MSGYFQSKILFLFLQVFDASEFAAHPMYSVAQGGLDLQQVTGIHASFLLKPFFAGGWGNWGSLISNPRSTSEGSGRRELASPSRVRVACPNLLIWHEALEREQLSVKLQLLFSRHKSYIPSWNTMPWLQRRLRRLLFSPASHCSRSKPASAESLREQHCRYWQIVRKRKELAKRKRLWKQNVTGVNEIWRFYGLSRSCW